MFIVRLNCFSCTCLCVFQAFFFAGTKVFRGYAMPLSFTCFLSLYLLAPPPPLYAFENFPPGVLRKKSSKRRKDRRRFLIVRLLFRTFVFFFSFAVLIFLNDAWNCREKYYQIYVCLFSCRLLWKLKINFFRSNKSATREKLFIYSLKSSHFELENFNTQQHLSRQNVFFFFFSFCYLEKCTEWQITIANKLPHSTSSARDTWILFPFHSVNNPAPKQIICLALAHLTLILPLRRRAHFSLSLSFPFSSSFFFSFSHAL